MESQPAHLTACTHRPGTGCGAAQLRAQAAGPRGALQCRPWLACPAPATGRAPAWHRPRQGLPLVPVVGGAMLGPHLLLPLRDQSSCSSKAGLCSLYHQIPNPKSTPWGPAWWSRVKTPHFQWRGHGFDPSQHYERVPCASQVAPVVKNLSAKAGDVRHGSLDRKSVV